MERARVVLALLAFAVSGAHGATFYVTSTANAGAGTLRQAVTDANNSPGADTIAFSLTGCPCTITLAASLSLIDEVTIAGPGMDVLAVSGGNAIQPFLTAGVPVTLSGFTVRNGLATFGGGGLRSYGPLTLDRMRFLSNRAPNVGGAVMFGAALTVVDSVFEQNSAPYGGGLYTEGASLAATRVTFRSNAASTVGGAFYSPGEVTLADSLLELNSAFNGGAVSFFGPAATITNTTFNRNSASNNGGGLDGSNFTVQGCTFTTNSAGSGGGAINAIDAVSIVNSTFTNNSSVDAGGAVSAWNATTVAGSTFTGNTTRGAGGAISVLGQMTITGSRFTGNTGGASFIGGGAILFDYNATQLSIADSVFESNSAPTGGAILGFSLNGALAITRTDFRANTSTQSGGAIATLYGGVTIDRARFFANASPEGGALSVGPGLAAQVSNSLFAGNSAASATGRAISLNGSGAVSLLHVTIANAGTRFTGSAIQGSVSAPLVLANSIVADHEVALRLTGGSSAPDRVLVWNAATPHPTFLVQGSATIDTSRVTQGNPAFVNAAGEDYHLGVGSVAVNLSPTARLATDYDGDARPQGAAHDAGYDERVPGAQAITFAALADRGLHLSPFAVSASTSSGLIVSFSSLTTGTCTVSGTQVSLVAMGTCTIAADQAGNAFWAAAPRVSRSFAVTVPYYPLTISQSGSGVGTVTSSPAGIDCGSTCAASFALGSVVTLTASVSAGTAFSGWSGACTGTGTCQVTIAGATTVGATFLRGYYVLAVSRAGAGTGKVTSSPSGIDCGATCAAPYSQGTVVTLTAAPVPFSVFTGWSGEGCSGTGTCQVTLSAARSVTATFGIQQQLLSVTKSGEGSGTVTSSPAGIDCGSACSASFATGASVTLAALPATGSVFGGWSGDCSGTAGCSLAMEAAKMVGALFKPSATIPRLGNIATRMRVLTGNDVLIGGFIIAGAQPKSVVIRARGPSLAAAGVPGTLANPVLQLFAGSVQIAANDNWAEAANAASISSSGFAPSDPFESAILATLTPGAYTAIVTGAGGGTGVGIIEVFEIDLPEAPLANISTRGVVLTGADVMIGGFIIQGDAPQTVIVRARGPSLAQAGVPGVLLNPMLQLFAGSTQIAVNDNWGDGPDAAVIQAAGFAPAHPLESAIRVTLAPGAYTAIVTGAGGATGVAIVEVFAQ